MLVKDNTLCLNIFLKVHLLVCHTSKQHSLLHGHGTYRV